MKKYFLVILLQCITVFVYAQSAPTFTKCEDDSTFFRIVTSRPMPVITCDTVYLITKQNHKRLSVVKYQNSDVNASLKKEIELYKQQNQNLQLLSDRHKQHVDSLNVYIAEKDKQLTEMNALAKRATENTDRALRVAKKNRVLAIGGGILSAVLLVLLIAK
jgi:hypothetical protein